MGGQVLDVTGSHSLTWHARHAMTFQYPVAVARAIDSFVRFGVLRTLLIFS
jgi:hypothetical protein